MSTKSQQNGHSIMNGVANGHSLEPTPETSDINPIKSEILIELTKLGFNQQNLKFTSVTLTPNHVVVRDVSKVSSINLKTRQIYPMNVKVWSGIMNPSANVLALRVAAPQSKGESLQVFNMDMKTRMKTTVTTGNVLFWKWVNANTIAYVTSSSVFHWSMQGNSQPAKQFDLLPERRPVQILNYDVSQSGNWLFLQGIARNTSTNSMDGVCQFYSVEKRKFQPRMDAFGACFIHVPSKGRDLFCFARRVPNNGTKLTIIELDNPDKAKTLKIELPLNLKPNDFVLAMVPNSSHCCLYVITFLGHLYLVNLLKRTSIHEQQISQVTLLSAISTHSVYKSGVSNGVITLDRSGIISRFTIDEKGYREAVDALSRPKPQIQPKPHPQMQQPKPYHQRSTSVPTVLNGAKASMISPATPDPSMTNMHQSNHFSFHSPARSDGNLFGRSMSNTPSLVSQQSWRNFGHQFDPFDPLNEDPSEDLLPGMTALTTKRSLSQLSPQNKGGRRRSPPPPDYNGPIISQALQGQSGTRQLDKIMSYWYRTRMTHPMPDKILQMCLPFYPTNPSKLVNKRELSLLQKWIVERRAMLKPPPQHNRIDSINCDLIFRASVDGFKATDFHRCCDGVGATLTIFRSEHGNIFGGFTSVPWTSPGFGGATFRDRSAFIFLLRSKYSQKNFKPPQNFVFRSSDYGKTIAAVNHNGMDGPRFGDDISICSECNVKRKSNSFFPTAYHCLSNQSLQTKMLLAGSHTFLVTEYETFHVSTQST